MPEIYWGGVAMLVVMQTTLGPNAPTSIERIVATAIGALEAFYFGANLITFALGIFIAGLLSIAFVSPPLCERYSYYYLLHFMPSGGRACFVSVRSHLVDALK